MSTRYVGLIVLAAWLSLASAMTPAGTLIISQAAAEVSGERYFSNEVQSVVRSVCHVSLLPDGTAVAPGQLTGMVPGGHAYLPYLISNTGNDVFELPLTVDYHARSDWRGTDAVFYLDENRNGRVDTRERAVTSVALAQEESRYLVLEVTAPRTAHGSAFVAPLTACRNRPADADNVAELRVSDGPVLAVETHASPIQPEPGTVASFDAILTNIGGDATEGAVTFSDLFEEGRLEQLEYRPGSARASSGLLEYWTGSAWTTTEPEEVLGLRTTVPNLVQDQQVSLRFEMQVDPAARPGPRTHVVAAEGPGGPARAMSVINVLPLREHHLGPRANPVAHPGGEGSVDDLQEIPYLLTGDLRCLDLTLINPGTGPDAYNLEAVGLPDGLTGTFRTVVGTPLQQPIPLEVAEAYDFEYCVIAQPSLPTPPDPASARPAGASLAQVVDVSPGFEMRIVAVSTRTGQRNGTTIRVGPVMDEPPTEQELSADPPRYVRPGGDVEYLLRIDNTSPAPITNLRLHFPLPELQPEIDELPGFVSATEGGTYRAAQRSVDWLIPQLPGGETFTAKVVVSMPGEIAEGENHAVPARFSFTAAEIGTPRRSNQLVHVFPSQALDLESRVAPATARAGDVVRYTHVLSNPSRQAIRVRLATRLPDGLEYVTGSGRVEGKGHVFELDPTAPADAGPEEGGRLPGDLWDSGEALRWDLLDVGELRLAPGGEAGDRLTLTYRARLLPGADGSLVDLAEASGVASIGGFELMVVSNPTRTTVQAVEDAVPAAELELSAEPERFWLPGSRASYALRVENTGGTRLTDLEIALPLPELRPDAALRPEFVSATGGGAYDDVARDVRWRLPLLEPGEAFSAQVVLSLPEATTDGRRNHEAEAAFTLAAAELGAPSTSNAVTHVVPFQGLLLDTAVAPASARVGERVTYTLELANPSRQAMRIRLATLLPEGLEYVPGSGHVSAFGFEAAFEPERPAPPADSLTPLAGAEPVAGTLYEGGTAARWDFTGVDELVLAPAGEDGDRLTVTYAARVVAGAPGERIHWAEGWGVAPVGDEDLTVVVLDPSPPLEILPDLDVELELAANPPMYLRPGGEVTYALRIENAATAPITDLRVDFPLPTFRPTADLRLGYVDASDGGRHDPSRNAATWTVPRLEPGEAFEPRLLLSIPEESIEGDNYAVPASFTVTADQIVAPRRSNELVHVFPSQALLIDTTVAPRVARVGDRLTYTLRVTNPSKQSIRIRLATRLPDRTEYVAGTGRVQAVGFETAFEPRLPGEATPTSGAGALRAGAAAPAPRREGDYIPGTLYESGEALRWDFMGIDELILAPSGVAGDSLTVTYDAVLLPGVSGSLVHLAEASGVATVGGFELAVVSNQANVVVEVEDEMFQAPRGTLTGRVYLDEDGDRVYDPRVDAPLRGARLLLANGWQANTDDRGIYTFRELETGAWSLMLDRATAPFPPAQQAHDSGSPYLRLTRVDGLTVEDFPLVAPQAVTDVDRTTRLVFGPVTVEKRLEPDGDGLVAVLALSSTQPLDEFVLTDPLPGGGERVFAFDPLEGAETIRYELPAGSRLTDPDVRWKDPLR